MELKQYTRKNQSYKMAAPKANDGVLNKKPPLSRTSKPLEAPKRGEDYIYGFAHIPAGRKNKNTTFTEYEINPMGWMLPGGVWTGSNKVAQDAAIEIDRLIKLCGGLPAGFGSDKSVN
jgi:hypothetical protein